MGVRSSRAGAINAEEIRVFPWPKVSENSDDGITAPMNSEDERRGKHSLCGLFDEL
jgi:hypothetical protein